MPPSRPPSTSDWAVLAFLGEGPAHGFRLAAAFSRGGELGSVWTLQRPQVYRAIEHLGARGWVGATGREPGDNGPPRTLYALTEPGRQALSGWLETPVEHLRDARSELLLKLVFTERRGLDAEPLLSAQHRRFTDTLRSYRARLERASGPERVTLEWRVASACAALGFLEGRLRGPATT